MSSLNARAKALFLDALDRPPTERREFLANACGDDAELRREVESLLAFHDEDEGNSESGEPRRESHEQPGFAAGDVFAGRYRMVARIGAGGMGEVWRADDLVLETPVALKLLRGAGTAARARILNEVRLARQITHPNVCRVFDVGEADGEVFYSMELVRGEDLATLLRRAGNLPSDRVVEIARQLCDGLSAAHARGVLHRDLKPANVLMDEQGAARITDFGIAVSRSEAKGHTLIGTPEYMAPEQLVPGGRLTERTDLFALGVLLYELVTGRHPFKSVSRQVAPPLPSTLASHVDPKLEAAIMRAVSVDLKQRPESAAAMAALLPSPAAVAPVATVPRRFWFGLAAALVVGVAVLLGVRNWRSLPQPLSAQDTIVLADFTNTTGDPVFDRTLKVALAVAVEQSPFLKVFPDERVQETLRLMNRPSDARITRDVAREIAQREHLKALVSGSIGPLGQHYVLAVEAINAQTGDVMAREQVEAGGKEEVLGALGGAVSTLRGRLGESLASIQKFDTPLPRATTPSLDALHAYALGLDEGRLNPRLEALPHLKRALDLDPDFALAHAAMATVYSNTGQTMLAAPFARRAFELRDRVSERERYFIQFRYYRDATQNWDRALDLARQWTAAYPREAFAFNSLAISLLRFGRYEETLAPYREAIRLDPKFAPLYSNLAGSLMALERWAEAKAVIKQGEDLGIDYFSAHRVGYLIAFVEGNQAEIERHVAAATGVGQNNAAYGWRAHGLAFNGRMEESHEQFRLGSEIALQGGFKEVAARLIIEDYEGRALLGMCDDMRPVLEKALALSRDNFGIERSSRALALCGQPAESLRLMNELAERFPEATLVARISQPTTRALIAVERRDPEAALTLLEPVRPLDHAPWSGFWPAYLRGLAYLQRNDGGAAASEFATIVDHRGEDPDSLLYVLALLGRARGEALAGKTGDAQKSYDRLLGLWKDADASVPAVKEARDERARLARPAGE